jgi:hypothetical protein
VASLAFSPRFQQLTDGKQLLALQANKVDQVAALVATLPQDFQSRLRSLQRSSARVLAIYASLGLDAAATETTRECLERLEWIYLKLLVARNHVTNELGQETLPQLTARIARMESQSGNSNDAAAGTQAAAIPARTGALDRSQEATLAILRRRAENLRSRDRLLAENGSDLERIEAQVDLMRENAAIEGKPEAVDMEIELASDLASPDIFGTQSSLISSLDRVRR